MCANIEFPSPASLIEGAVAAAFGTRREDDRWQAGGLLWPLLEVLDAASGEPWLPRLGERRLARVQQLAGLYEHYATWRPAMLRAWARGQPVDGTGHRLPSAAAWQAELWLRLRHALGVPSLPERLDQACERLREHPALLSHLPGRVSLFGLTRLPPSHLQILRAISTHREVNLFVLHPSPALWDAIAATPRQPLAPRRYDATAEIAHNGLLASWGRDARELQLVLRARPQAGADRATGAPLDGESAARSASSQTGASTIAHHGLPAELPDTLLARIQADVSADRAPPGPAAPGAPDARMVLREDDRSLQIHACHGRPRQVQALHDAILHALAQDPTLEPRDVIVMCPDIETFAPLITATFAADADGGGAVAASGAPTPGPPTPGVSLGQARSDLRVRLADRSLRATNPLLSVIARLLELADSRVSASQLLDLIDAEPVRRRFGLHDDDLAQIRDWILASAIHWGLDDRHRNAFKLARVPAGTWQAGLNRILLGVAVGETGSQLFAQVLPVDDLGSDAIDLAGRFAELVDRLTVTLRELAGPHPLATWMQALGAAADSMTACAERDVWQRLECNRLLEAVGAEASGTSEMTTLALGELRALLGDRLAGRPTRANFRTGHLTVCTLVPMRSVPHRVVCVLGLDDGVFPRGASRNGDDILLAEPVIGDRDPRSEDRQMLLDALLAAREQLIVTYTGNDECTNAVRPPAVVVGELLDTIEATARCEDGTSARGRALTRHPLQPFDERNFLAGALLTGKPWSFDPVALEGAEALRGERSKPAPLLIEPLPETSETVLALVDLIAFVQRPVRAFLAQRLGISVAQPDADVSDALPVELGPLARWAVGQRLLEDVLDGTDARTALLAEIARGTLPPGELGRAVIQQVWPDVESLSRHARAYAQAAPPRVVQTVVALPPGPGRQGPAVLMTGTVSGVHGTCCLNATYSALNARHRVGAWVRLLALTAARPEAPFSAVTVGRGGSGGSEVAIAHLAPLAATAAARRTRALALLGELADLRRRGMREPLPIACLTSAAYAQAAHSGAPPGPTAAAQKAWSSGFGTRGEDREPEHRLVYGADLPLIELLAASPDANEQGEGWDSGESSRLAARAPPVGSAAGERADRAVRGPVDGGRSLREGHAVRLARSAAIGRHRAGGERRDRQDVHDRRARDTLRRVGRAT